MTGPMLSLIGGFQVQTSDEPLDLPASARRLIAFLALNPRPLARSFVSGVLWPETGDAKASGSLRNVLWRLNDSGVPLVHATNHSLELDPSVDVDVQRVQQLWIRLYRNEIGLDVMAVDPTTLSGELLPGLWDPWLLFERERFRQVSLHTLELLSRRLSDRGEHNAAVLAALAAVEAEPLRETANMTLADAHIAEGNAAEAVRQYERFASLLRSELGASPADVFRERIRDCCSPSR